MSPAIGLEPHEWDVFTVPYGLRLLGEQQHLIGAGSLSMATHMRLSVAVDETADPFTLRLGVTHQEETGRGPVSGPPTAHFAVAWEKALRRVAVADPSSLDGLAIDVDFGPTWGLCPADVLATSDVLSVALTVAAVAHRGREHALSEMELALLAGRVHEAATEAMGGSAGPFYADAVISIVGGAGYVNPGEGRINVQQLLPPESFLLVLSPDAAGALPEQEREEDVRKVLGKAVEGEVDLAGRGDEAFSALFAEVGGALDEQEVAMVYGLMRVRQMIESFVDSLGDASVDNDRLAEICDEESVILEEYFGFPGELYDDIRRAASQAGGLGAKLTWAFGACPAAVVIAPGRRQQVAKTIQGSFPDAHCLLVNMDTRGLLPGEEEASFSGSHA